jgi:hypothetical protein
MDANMVRMLRSMQGGGGQMADAPAVDTAETVYISSLGQ